MMMGENNILIVDDDPAICDSMSEYLQLFGFRCQAVSSAEKALAAMDENSFQVVITDIMLPGMDGLQLTDNITKKHDADIIVMTGYSGDYSYEEAIQKGASDFLFKPVRFEELLLRLKRVLRERLLTNERIRMLEELKKLAITDGLTGLYNSRYFYTQLKAEVDRAIRYGHPLSLLLLDIDYFKQYNDRYGHLEGDKVLVRLGKIIQANLRKSDTAYRYGGEEFTILLPETKGSRAEKVALRLRAEAESEIFFPESGKKDSITISVGVTQYRPKEKLSDFIKRSDKAMYISKEKGRNRVSSIFE